MIILKIFILWLLVGFVSGFGALFIMQSQKQLLKPDALKKAKEERTEQQYTTHVKLLNNPLLLLAIITFMGPIFPFMIIIYTLVGIGKLLSGGKIGKP